MNRRDYLGGYVASVVLAAGCLGQGSDGTPGPESDEGPDGSPDPDAPLELGEWGQVTDRTATRPTDVRLADRIVFEHPYDDDVVWESSAGEQFLLVEIERRITDAPADVEIRYHGAEGDLLVWRSGADG